MRIGDREINRVLILDDDPAARDGYAYPVEELQLEAIRVLGPIETPESFVGGVKPSDAVVCDYHLKKRSYALLRWRRCRGGVLQSGHTRDALHDIHGRRYHDSPRLP